MASDPASFRSIRFSLDDLGEQVEGFWHRWPDSCADEVGQQFVSADGTGRLRLPLAGPRAQPGEHIGDYFERLPADASELDECQLVLLLRAGALAFGCWQGRELVQHKAVRKYVVRGSGKAQSTHLKTRGKSRYGSRLRLQNWRSLLGEANERIADCEQQFGPFERIFFGVPVRVFSELFEADPKPVFARDAAELQRIPMHVHRPDYEELLRVRAWLARGRVELPS
ncbi:MAG: hypothetical protein ACI89X_000374 [Planctomycetota bacterium]|jgi:hypothetical protein